MEGTARTALFASVAVGIAIAQQVIARASRDALYLAQFDATQLPQVMLATAVFSLVVALAGGHWMVQRGPRVVLIGLGLTSAAVFGVEGALLSTAPGAVAAANYIQVSVIGAMVVSGLWSIINERFDPYSARRRFARIGAGAALGGVAGGVLVHGFSEQADLRTVLWALSGLSIVVSVAGWLIGPPIQRAARGDATAGGLRAIRRSPYLIRIATVVIALGAAGTLVDYAMKATAEAQFDSTAKLLSFFGIFYTLTSVGTLLVQLFVSRPVLQKLGLGAAMISLPAVLAATAGVGILWTRLATVVVAKALERVLASSLFRSGYELLYAPIAPTKKRAVKAFIDVACDKVGNGAGSLIVLGLVALTATPAVSWSLGFAVVASLVSVVLMLALRKDYVEELAVSLRAGSLELGQAGLVDLTTRHSLTTTPGIDPQMLAAIIDSASRQRPADSGWRAQFEALTSQDQAHILEVLESDELSPHVGPALIELLRKDEYARPAQDALIRIAPKIIGQLVDALLDPESPQIVRRRIPRVLSETAQPRAAAGLLEGLRDRDPQVRFRCGQALSKIKKADPHIDVPRSHIYEMVQRETHMGRPAVPRDSGRSIDSEIHKLLRTRDDPGLEHIFTLLSLVFDRHALVMSFRALGSEDERLRGTALEYLLQILPEQLRDDLWPRLVDQSVPQPRGPTTRDITELLRSMETSLVEREEDDRVDS
jgi:AAA family ATP:ADP antiporter